MAKPIATWMPSEDAEDDEDHDADDADRRVLAVEVGLRALLDRGRNLLHPRRAGVGGEDLPRGDNPYATANRPQMTMAN